MATRMTARVFVGRSSQLAELEAALTEAAAGRAALVFVAGEPGLGKTRLLDELHHRVRATGSAITLWGDCVALGEGELPYAPLVGALRPLARAGDPVIDALPDATRAALATLIPSLAVARPEATPFPPANPSRPDPSDQSKVFEALLELIDGLSARSPVVLTIEDLHWADASTRAFLRFLSVNLCRERVLVIGTYRPDELHRRHPLRPLLADLERESHSRRITLEPLTREELAEQLEDILGSSPPEELLERMYRRSEGNPLFTEELVAAGPDGRGALPPTLRDALMVRIERLSDGAQDLLRLIAVARSVDHVTLAASATTSGRVLSDALREAIEAQILTVDGDERYRFRHALLREAVGDDLLPGERAELHLTLARALEGAAAGPGAGVYRTTAVAHHYQAAGDQPAALVASVRAADAAEEVHAAGESATLLERALELWDRVPDAAGVTGMTEVLLLERAAKAHFAHGGGTARVETLLSRALELLGDADPIASARMLERLAHARWHQNRQADTLSTLDHALALLPPGPSPERAWRLAGKARFLMLMGRYREAADTARTGASLARETGARKAEGNALNALGVSLASLGDLEAGSAALREAEAIATDTGNHSAFASAAVNLSDVLHLAGRTPEAIAVAEQALASDVALGRHDLWLRIALAEFEIDTGRWADAATRLGRVGRHQGTTQLNLQLRQAELALARGEDERAGETLARANRSAEGSREPQFVAVLYTLLAEHATRAGDLIAARSAIEEGLDRIEFCTDDVHRITRLAAAGVRVEADIAQRARDLGHSGEAADASQRAAALAERVAAADDVDDAAVRPVEHAHWLTSIAEQGRAAGLAEPVSWAQAAAAWDALGRPYTAAQARWREAEALVLTGDRDRAASAAGDVQTTAIALGAARLEAEIGALMARARLRPAGEGDVPEAAAPGDRAIATAQDPFGLTSRERQVLALVAGGATNREVGARLYMAEKTASVHVSRILSKLDVRSRTEAAAVAHRLGLADG